MASGVQPRGTIWPQLVPEDKSIISVTVAAEEVATWTVGRRSDAEKKLGGKLVPKGSRLIEKVKLENMGKDGLEDEKEKIRIGIPWSEAEFVSEAMKKGHPCNSFPKLRPSLKQALLSILRHGPEWTMKHRERVLEHWESRAASLAPEEKALHEKMEPGVEQVLRDKHLLLLKEMLLSIGYPDAKVVDELVTGFPIVGELVHSGAFPARRKEAEAERAWAHSHARLFREEARRGAQGGSGNEELDKAVYEGTLGKKRRSGSRPP